MNEQPKLSAMMFSSEEVMALPRSQEPEWNIESKTSFWNNPFGKLIRWLAFIPVGFVLGSILQVLPPLGVELARSYEPEFNFLTILIAVFAVSILGIVGWFWVLGVFATPVLSCRIIAPNRRVGSVILGTLFCLVLDIYMLGLFGQASWVFILYQLVFSAIFIFGIITAYNEDGAIIVAAVFFWRTNTQRTPSIAEEQSRSEAPTSKSRGDEPVKAGKPINWREVKFGNDEAQYGASLIRSGIRDYRSWSESMALKYGEPVRENLSSIYSEAETRAAAVDAMEQESRELLGPSVWRSLENAAWSSDAVREDAMLPLRIAYNDLSNWRPERLKFVVDGIAVLSVNVILSEMKPLPEKIRNQCRNVTTQPQAVKAADEVESVLWSLGPNDPATSREIFWATRAAASQMSWAAVEASWGAIRAAWTLPELASAAAKAADAARTWGANPDDVLRKACKIWIHAADWAEGHAEKQTPDSIT